jgi:hypothetical protein
VPDTLPNPQDHRFLIRQFESAANLAFVAAHELVHANIASLALGGLLGSVDEDGLNELHKVAEGIAVLVGDLELPELFQDSEYLAQFWPPATQTTHGNSLNPVGAFHAAGLPSSDDRAAWVRDLYLEAGEHLPSVPQGFADRAVSLSMLYEEQRYARKVRDKVLPSWAAYWRSPELRAFVEHFVPAAPTIIFRAEGEPVEIRRPEEFFDHWRAVSLDWSPPPDDVGNYWRARIETQRVALRFAELLRAVRSRRWLPFEGEDGRTQRAIARAWEETVRLFEPLRPPLGRMTAEESAERVASVVRLLSGLRADLVAMAGDGVWRFTHPALTGEAMDDRPAANSFSRYETASADELAQLTKFLDSEATDYYQMTGDTDAAALAAAAHGHSILLGTAPAEAQVNGARDLVRSVVSSHRLKQAFPLEWIDGRPFAEPCTGFRFS